MASRFRGVTTSPAGAGPLAEVAKSADALASGASARKGVWVRLPSSVPPSLRPRFALVPRWRNWYTRTFEGRMTQVIRVQVPAWAPTPSPDKTLRDSPPEGRFLGQVGSAAAGG